MSYFRLSLFTAAVFFISFLATTLIKRLGIHCGWIAVARKDRWHTREVALYGGCGFFPSFLVGVIWLIVQTYGINGLDGVSQNIWNKLLLLSAVPFGGFILFLVGMWDDIKPIRPVPKLFFQLAAATPLIYLGGASSITGIQLIDILFTYFWFVGIINAVNLLDNMDGLASGVVIISSVTLMVLHLQAVEWKLLESMPALILLTFTAALLGFWVYNRPPASIFMGDAGSLSIGFVLAGFTLPQSFNSYTGFELNPGVFSVILPVLLPMMILAVPIFDTTFVTITRSWRSQNIAVGGRDHSSHRMVILGLSEKETLLIFYGIAVLGSIFAILMQSFQDYSLLLFGGFGIALILIGIYLAHVKIETSNKTLENTISWLPHKYKTTWYKRNVAEMLLDVIIIVFCFYGSYLLRFEGNLTGSPSRAISAALPWVVVSTLFSLIMAGVYRSRWRFISIAEIPVFVYGVVGGTVLSLAIMTLLSRFGEGYSRSAFVIFGFLLFTALVGSRLSFRWLDFIFMTKKKKTLERKKSILIYGSGKEAKLLYEVLSLDPKIERYEIVGFIDCEGEAAGNALCGLPIKTESEWLQFSWQSKPRIFIPLSFAVDELVDELAQRWEHKGIIYRFKVAARPVRSTSKVTFYRRDV